MIKSELDRNSPRPVWQRLFKSKVILACLAICTFGATSAFASHFRGASLTWKRLASPANTVEVTVTEGWRVSPGNTYNWGDGTGTFTTSGATVIASGTDLSGAFLVVRKVITHTYASEGPWTITSTGSARIAFVNSNQTAWTLNSVVDLRGGNQGSPVISSPIVLQMVHGGLNTMPLSYADVDGDNVTFRMATTAESSITSVASAGGKTLSVSSSGVLSWDTSSTTVGQFYAVQVIANDNHHIASPSGTGTTKVFFDFMIQIVDGSLNKPPVATGASGPFTAAIGQLFTYTVTGTDPDGDNLTVTQQSLPPGATLSPGSGTTGPQPLAATLSWTPTLADAGSSVGAIIVFTDPSGLTASKSISISVPSNQPPVASAGPDQTFFDIDGNDTPIVVNLNGTGSYDPENAPITYAWTQTGGTPVALANANTATPSFSAPSLQNHPNGQPAPLLLTFQLAVSDGNSTRTDDVVVTIKHNNLVPVAAASAPASAPEGSAIVLDGSGSSDPDGDPLTYTWTQTGGTPVVLGGNGTNNPQLTFSSMVNAPHSNPGETLTFAVTVSDGIASSTSAPVQVFVRNVNQAPTADAGHDETVFDNVGAVQLEGAGFDLDGDTISYSWTQIAGPTVALTDANSPNASFIAPAVSPAQGSVTLTFKLTASDSNGAGDTAALTGSSTVNILVRHANRAPIADAGQNLSVPEQTLVTLDGSGSYDPDNDALTYSWVQTGGTAVTLNGANTASPTFTGPNVGPAGATLTFALTVTDVPAALSGTPLTSAPKSVTVTVKYVNQPPTIAGDAPQTQNEGTVVMLHTTASDPDGNTLAYSWTQVSGPLAALSLVDPANPTFTAPLVPFGGGVSVYKATVDDGYGGTASVSLTVNIANVNNPPVADAGPNQSVPEGSAVSLTGLASSDLDGEPLTYAWVQTAGPAVTLTGANTATPGFTTPLVSAGGDPTASVTLTFRLTVRDLPGDVSFDDIDVKVVNVDHAPTANAGGSQSVGEAVPVTLNASASVDPDGDPLTYLWTQVSGPTVTLSSATAAKPTFTAPFVGPAGTTLKFMVVVRDPFGGSNSDTATVSVFNTNTPPDASHAAASTASLWPPNHQMVPISIVGVIDPDNNATITITSVSQDEPTNGLGDGDTPVDAIIQGSTVLIRSERAGNGNGRVYHIHFTASDFEGSASGVVTVSVPHDKKGDVAIDGGELYDSTK